MVYFLTLFLVLTSGVQPVSLAVEPPVERVELVLDGRTLAELTGAPWTVEVDFGPLAPHRLEAVGYDAEGREVTRASRLINLPHSRAEAGIVLERNGPSAGAEAPPRRARLVWETVEDLELERAEVRFDGRPLPVADPAETFSLPDYDPSEQHYLVAELIFEGGLRSEAAVGLGGEYGAEIRTELTAVVVRRRAKGAELPPPAEMEGWFLHRGEPVPVRAVEAVDPERGGVDFYLARDLEAFLGFREVAAPKVRGTSRPNWMGGKGDVLRPGDRGFLVHPVPDDRAVGRGEVDLFPMSPALHRSGRGGLTWLLAEVRFRGGPAGGEELAEATAVAGLKAARGRPRVVVALLHPESRDGSAVSWSEVRRYLASLRVPLHLWTPVRSERLPAGWERVEPLPTPRRFRQAIRDLREAADAQVVVWLEGSFLPGEIELSEEALAVVGWAG